VFPAAIRAKHVSYPRFPTNSNLDNKHRMYGKHYDVAPWCQHAELANLFTQVATLEPVQGVRTESLAKVASKH